MNGIECFPEGTINADTADAAVAVVNGVDLFNHFQSSIT